MPPGIVCYICGRKYGTKSIDIHQKQCEKKFQQEQAQLPKSERKKLPTKPQVNALDEMKVGGKMSQAQQDAYNNAAFEEYNNNALSKCSNCSRTFLLDRLVVHQRSCKVPVSKTPQINSSSKLFKPGAGAGPGTDLVNCSNCGKQYSQKLIDYHMKRCADS